MSIEYKRNVARLQGVVTVDEAESMLAWIQGHKTPKIDLSECTHLHCAELLIMLAFRPAVTAWPADQAFGNWVKTSLQFTNPA